MIDSAPRLLTSPILWKAYDEQPPQLLCDSRMTLEGGLSTENPKKVQHSSKLRKQKGAALQISGGC